jgi:hypothetical protein
MAESFPCEIRGLETLFCFLPRLDEQRFGKNGSVTACFRVRNNSTSHAFSDFVALFCPAPETDGSAHRNGTIC